MQANSYVCDIMIEKIIALLSVFRTPKDRRQKLKNYEGDCYAKRNKCNCYGLYLFK